MTRQIFFKTFALLAIAAPTTIYAASNSVYAEIRNTQSYTTPEGPIPIAGLSINLPAASASYNAAIVTLNMPNLYLSNPTKAKPMSAEFSIVAPEAPGGVLAATGIIGCDTTGISVSGPKPLTIVLELPLGTTEQFAEAEWFDNNGAVTTESFASISAILVLK